MAFFRGEEGSVSFDNGTGSVGAVASTTAWSLDITKDTLDVTAHGDTSRKNIGSLKSGSGTVDLIYTCLLYTSPSPRDGLLSRMPSSA